MNAQKPPAFVPMTAANEQGTARVTGLEFATNIQHPKPNVLLPGVGDRSTQELGKTIVSVVVKKEGPGLILVQTTHSDGTTLGSFYDKPTLDALRQCLDQAERQLVQMEIAAQSKPD